MTGDGLRFAMRGGELAAEAALRELSTGVAACAQPPGCAREGVRSEVADQPRAPGARRLSARGRRRVAALRSSGTRRSGCSFVWRAMSSSSQHAHPEVIISVAALDRGSA